MDEFELFTTFTFNNRSVEVFADFGVSIIDRNWWAGFYPY